MTMIRADSIEVGVKGQSLTVRGFRPPEGDNRYGNEQELELPLPLARELYRLLGKLIPLAEKSGPPAAVASLPEKASA